MQLIAFAVQGFKNIVSEIALSDLKASEVIHGENNVGKSNLVEAMDLFFSLLDVESDGWLPISKPAILSDDALRQRGFRRADIFNIDRPDPIKLTGTLAIESEELAAVGIRPLIPAERVTLCLVLTWRGGGDCELSVRKFEFADGTDATKTQRSAERKTFVLRFARFLVNEFIYKYARVRRFQVVPASRVFGLASDSEGIVPSELLLSIYDSSQSTDLAEARRAKLFLETIASFSDLVGMGQWIPTYDRTTQRANLVLETSSARIPLRLMGSGVQQLVVLIGRLLMTKASMVAIEEPEINLRYTIQLRLRACFLGLVGKRGGPSQIIVTSHSPAFEVGESFLWMRAGLDGPTVVRRSAQRAGEVTGIASEVPSPHGPIPLGYVSTDGYVRVPDRVRNQLGVENGGEVMFVGNEPGMVELVSEATFSTRYDGPNR